VLVTEQLSLGNSKVDKQRKGAMLLGNYGVLDCAHTDPMQLMSAPPLPSPVPPRPRLSAIIPRPPQEPSDNPATALWK
jgi:hypothetical protein